MTCGNKLYLLEEEEWYRFRIRKSKKFAGMNGS